MNVSAQDGKQKKKVLVAEKDFEPGDVIYKVTYDRVQRLMQQSDVMSRKSLLSLC